jgi:hypothetical protein
VSRAASWQAVLLLPHPILTLLYLLAVRAERVPPGFAPVVALGLLPFLSAVIGVVLRRRPESASGRSRQRVLLAIAALEVSFTVLAAAIVGFAIGLRSL